MSRERMGAAPELNLPSKEEQLERELKRIQAERRPEELLSRRSGYAWSVMMNEQHVENYKKDNRRSAAIATAEWVVHANKEKLNEVDHRLGQFTTEDFLDARTRVQEKLKALEDQKEQNKDTDDNDLESKIKSVRMNLATLDRHLEDQGFTQREIRTHQSERQKAKQEMQLPDITDELTEADDDIIQVEDSDLMTDDSGVHEKPPITEKRPRRPDVKAVAHPPAEEPAPESGERLTSTEKRPRKPIDLGTLDNEPANDATPASVPEPNERLSEQAEAPDLRKIDKEEKAESKDRINAAIDGDKDVVYWRGQLASLSRVDTANTQLRPSIENKVRKAELLAEIQASIQEKTLAEHAFETAKEDKARAQEMIERHEQMILEQKEAINNAKENSRREQSVTYLKGKKQEVEALRAKQDERTRELLDDPKLSAEAKAHIKDANRKLKEKNVVGMKADEIQAQITHDTEVMIPQYTENIARLEEEILGLQSELHRLGLVEQHAAEMKQLAVDRLEDAKVLLPGYEKINLEHREEIPDLIDTKRPAKAESKNGDNETIEVEDAELLEDEAQLPADLTNKTLNDLYDEFLAVPKGKRYDAKRERIDQKIKKVELLLELQKIKKQENVALEEATQLARHADQLQEHVDAKAKEAEEERARQIERKTQADQKRERREQLIATLAVSDPEKAIEIKREIEQLSKEISEDEKASDAHEAAVTSLEREAGDLSDQRDATDARRGIAVQNLELLAAALAALVVKLEPFKEVNIGLEAPEKGLMDKTKEKAISAAKATGRFADRHKGKMAIATGTGTTAYVAYKTGVLFTVAKYAALILSPWAVKKSWKTFNRFEKKMDQDGFFSALKDFIFEDEEKKKE